MSFVLEDPDVTYDEYHVKLTPTPLQEAFINSPAEETLYGGARGGGKTFAVILDWLIHSEAFGKYARGIVFRRSLTELDDFIEAAKDVLESSGHRWLESKKTFISPRGAKLRCRYLDNDTDANLYQGHAYSRIYIEEIGNFPAEGPIKKLLACLRPPIAKGPPIRCQLKATANPGGPGQTWVKARYIDPAPPLTPFSSDHGKRFRVFIPAKLKDNPHLLENDPTYIDRLGDVGSPELVRAWLEGDWDSIVGQYFPEFSREKHVIPTVPVPPHWKVRYRACDWGSAKPYAVLWFVVADGSKIPGVGHTIPRGSLVVYRELYGCARDKYGAFVPNTGLRQHSGEVAAEIKRVETDAKIIAETYLSVIDPSTFNMNGGPSIAEDMARAGVRFKRADNRRTGTSGATGGWNQVRKRLKGEEGIPRIFVMDCCIHLIRTLPMLPTDPQNPDDLDSEAEDHAADALRYGCMVRMYEPPAPKPQDVNLQYGRPMSSFTMDDAWKCGGLLSAGKISRG